ncbi:hypothetical protein SAMN05216226_11259 [Halovenus aranensis]|uniref:Uncharacterized protein n=1 Tax=Halovenus aranensis TaxID=890420 RepID=A0A1G8XSM9_9EURY|nr:hypothetical protein [Halovenus aranensis]SDJ93561.1 hypothetical protein SAMN05216226_11259 [Halovenus aranensis]
MNTKLHTVVAAAVLALALSAGGVAAADHVYSHSADSADELPEEYDLTVIDPDDRLTDGQAEMALELAWSHDDIQEEFDESESCDVTVQATGEDVTVVIKGDAGEAASADLDLDSETVKSVLPTEQIGTADESKSIAIGVDGNETEVEVLVLPLADASVEVVDENDVLTGDESRLTGLLASNAAVNDHVTDLLDRENESGVAEWTATVSEVDDSIFVDGEDAVAVELSYDGTEDAVKAFVDLDDEEVTRVVPVQTLDATESVGIDSDDVEIVDDESDE